MYLRQTSKDPAITASDILCPITCISLPLHLRIVGSAVSDFGYAAPSDETMIGVVFVWYCRFCRNSSGNLEYFENFAPYACSSESSPDMIRPYGHEMSISSVYVIMPDFLTNEIFGLNALTSDSPSSSMHLFSWKSEMLSTWYRRIASQTTRTTLSCLQVISLYIGLQAFRIHASFAWPSFWHLQQPSCGFSLHWSILAGEGKTSALAATVNLKNSSDFFESGPARSPF
jgi:hypothetical protein